MRKNYLLLITLVALFSQIFIASYVFCETASKPFSNGIIAEEFFGGHLVNLCFNLQEQKYEKKAEVLISDLLGSYQNILGAVVIEDNIFIATRNLLVKTDKNLRKISSVKKNNIESLATDGKNIFVGGEFAFIAFDKDLNESSRINLSSKNKDVNDILIYENKAYLLDDEMIPYFVYIVDIKNPKKMGIIMEEKIEGVNIHLQCQWLDPNINQWVVVSEYGHMGGSGQSAYIFSTGLLNRLIDELPIYSDSYIDKKFSRPGFSIERVTGFAPAWAIVQDKQELMEEGWKTYLAKIMIDGKKIDIEKVAELGESLTPLVWIRKYDNHLFCFNAYNAAGGVKIFEIQKDALPVLVSTIEGITPIAVY